MIRSFLPNVTRNSGKRKSGRANSVHGVELMEPRCLLTAAPLSVGAVYVEEDLGSDEHGDLFFITFEGGADGTQLTRAIIDGNQNGQEFGVGDVFFDTRPSDESDLGADDAFDFVIHDADGIDSVEQTVIDGTTSIELNFIGFDPGEILAFSIDVDEVEDYSPDETNLEIVNDGFDPITSGVEFQGSSLTVNFSAPHYENITSNSKFVNRYDDLLEGKNLQLREDNFEGKRDRSAGAADELLQTVIPSGISGHVFHDQNQNGIFDDDETGIAGAIVEILPLETLEEQAAVTLTTDENGRYAANGLSPGRYRIIETQPDDFLDGIDSVGTVDGQRSGDVINPPGDLIDNIFLPGGSQGINYDFGEILPASLRGQVHLADESGDCFSENIFHAPVEGAIVQLFDATNRMVAQTETDANGEYAFLGIVPGTYSIVEITPEGLIDGGARAGEVRGQLRGNLSDSDPGRISSIRLGSGENGTRYDFCEIEPVSISGEVHLADPSGDCFGASIEHRPIANVTVLLQDANGETIRETTTDREGNYVFLDLPPGTYSVVEQTPEGLFEGGAKSGTVNGRTVGTVIDSNTISQITLGPGQSIASVDFCEIEPVSISGQVHLGTPDGDCFGDRFDHRAISGVTVRLLNESGEVLEETQTDDNGQYAFLNLQPGTYSVVESTPEGLIDGGSHAGFIGTEIAGVAFDANTISDIVLGPGQQAFDVDFCEFEPARISGFVYHDENNNGRFESSESPIGNTEVLLVDGDGFPVDIAITDSRGEYRFEGLAAGNYAILENQPVGWLDGLDSRGTISGRIARDSLSTIADPNDEFRDIELKWGDDGIDFNFGELLPASISGNVHLGSPDGDCFGEMSSLRPQEGVRVQLLNDQGVVIQEARTDELGNYRFDDLSPGEYGIRQINNGDLIDGGSRAGLVAGQSSGLAVDANTIMQIEIGSAQQAIDYEFCDFEPANISGNVYYDIDNNGVRDPDGSEPPIPNVQLSLVDENGDTVASTVTNAKGQYEFDQIMPGRYSILEVQPQNYLDGLDAAGTINGSTNGRATNPGDSISNIEIKYGDQGINYNFGELVSSRIAGFVHSDFLVSNCTFDPENGDELLSDVQIELLDENGRVVARTLTDAQGRFEFNGLTPGEYSLREIQPVGYFDGESKTGDVIDDQNPNLIDQIQLGPGQSLEHFVFCEDPPVEISGYVFQDGSAIQFAPDEEIPANLESFRDGKQTADDTPIEGVELELRVGVEAREFSSYYALDGLYPDGALKVKTDARGFYSFSGLRRGTYSVYEFQPQGYLDGVDSGGRVESEIVTLSFSPAVALNQSDPRSHETLSRLEDAPDFDVVTSIRMPAGAKSELNNFSEVLVQQNPEKTIIPWLFVPEFAPPIESRPWEINVVVNRSPVPLELGEYKIKSYGKSRGRGNTWHLSVIDGGTPRGEGETLKPNGPIWLAARERYGHGWQITSMQAYKWTLIFEKDELRESFFGVPNGIPVAGDFNGDGFTELGIYFEGQWFIDINGNGRWDENDLWAKLGYKNDQPVTGDWDGDGKDDIGIFGVAWPGDPIAIAREPGLPDRENRPTGEKKNIPPEPDKRIERRRAMQLKANGRTRSDVIDHVFHFGGAGDRAVTGDWNGDGISTIGVFVNGRWRLDLDGNGKFTDKDIKAEFGESGDIPIVGDFNGDGVDEIGVYRNGVFYLDTNGNGELDETDQIIASDRVGIPVAGDFNGDGTDTVGVVERNEQPVELEANRP